MDAITLFFVFFLFAAAFLLVATFRREFRTEEESRHALQRRAEHARLRRKP